MTINSCSLLVDHLAHLLSCTVKVFIVEDAEVLLLARDHLLRLLTVGSLQSQHHWLGEFVLLVRLDNGRSQVVTSEDASENVDEDSLHLIVIVEQLQCLRQLVALGATSNIQEVCWLTSVELDDVHGGHGESGSIHQTSDVTANMDVVQVEFLSMLLTSILLCLILLVGQILLPVESIAVDGDLTVSGQYLSIISQHKWVDLNHVAVLGHEALVDPVENVGHLVSLGIQTKVLGGGSQVFLAELGTWGHL